jgi:mono/diheme cytochrome c family protein
MKSRTIIGLLFALILLFFLIPSRVKAHEPHACGDGFPDTPVLSGHIRQEQITKGELAFEEILDAGLALFEAVFNVCDGQGRPATTGTGEKRAPDEPAFIRTSAPDSSSCAGCHNQPRAAGGGDFVANVFVLAQGLDPVIESVTPEFSAERNTLGMFGAGPIEMLGREMTADLQEIRTAALKEARARGEAFTKPLEAKGVDFGSITARPDGSVDTSAVVGVDADLVVKPFHQAGVVRSIREFTVNAMNHHHGMQAEERFDLNPEKSRDFDEDGIVGELTIGDITAVTIYQAALSIPGQVLPAEREDREMITAGEKLFELVGCTSCHIPEMKLESRFFIEPNENNPPGTFSDSSQTFSFDMTEEGGQPRLEKSADGGAIVRPFTDLKRHNLCDDPQHSDPIRFFCNEQVDQGRPAQGDKPGEEYFLTRKLWDLGNSAPYGHRGDLTTITEAILVHGGEARAVRGAFVALSTEEQGAIVMFLKTLQILPAGSDRAMHEPAEAGISTTTMIPGPTGLLALGMFTIIVLWVIKPTRWVRLPIGASENKGKPGP